MAYSLAVGSLKGWFRPLDSDSPITVLQPLATPNHAPKALLQRESLLASLYPVVLLN